MYGYHSGILLTMSVQLLISSGVRVAVRWTDVMRIAVRRINVRRASKCDTGASGWYMY